MLAVSASPVPARMIRADADLSTTFLVAVTGYGQDDDRQLAREAGFNLHLTNPIGHDDLRKAIEKFEGC
jgi:CheY-like chemotaxis protein